MKVWGICSTFAPRNKQLADRMRVVLSKILNVMKRYLLFALLSLVFASCANDADDPMNDPAESRMKESEVIIYSGSHRLNAPARKALNPKDELGYSIPDAGRYLVYYYIRIDGNIPGSSDVHHPAKDYFPRTKAGKTMVCDLNHGYVTANVDWKQCAKFSKYIYSTDGSAVESIILEQPTIEELLAADEYPTDDFKGYIDHKDELHFLWYACKKQDADHVWHIDGVLTTKERTDISETDYGTEIKQKNEQNGMTPDKGNVVRQASVEVDVHQQEHKDWNEIKTSIHMRDTTQVEVFLPIGYEELADDFDIRSGRDYAYITELKDSKIQIGDAEYKLQVSITHEQDGIRILVKPNREALIAARQRYDDGITFEVHSYVTSGITTEAIWQRLKGTKCTTTPYTTIFGQITSAYYPEDRVEL